MDEVDALYQQPGGKRAPSPEGNKKKWQPLTNVAPNPEIDDNDPFSLGDSDDDKDKQTDLRAEDTLRLKKSASQSAAAPGKVLEPQEKTGSVGTRDKAAEDLMKGDSDQ